MGYRATNKFSLENKIKLIRLSISEEDLWLRYIPEFKKVGKLFISPLRKDTKPSAIVNNLNGKLIYNDFGSSDKGDIFEILKKYWNQSSLATVVDKIINDYQLDYKNNYRLFDIPITDINNKVIKEEKKAPTIEVEIRRWQHKDKFYWENYGISFSELKNNQIFPLGYFKIIKEDNDIHQFNDQLNTLIYGLKLTTKEGKVLWKIYQPLNQEYRFLTNIPWSLVEWDIIDPALDNQNKSLIITKSRKDKIIIDKIIDKKIVDIVVVQSERETDLGNLNDYKTILIIFDNDTTGIEFSTKLKKRIGENCINLSSLLEYKDSADYGKNKQLIRLKNLIDSYLP